jgi:hypothetical protein
MWLTMRYLLKISHPALTKTARDAKYKPTERFFVDFLASRTIP